MKNIYEKVEDLFDEVTCESSSCIKPVKFSYDDCYYCKECAEDKFHRVVEKAERNYKEYCLDRKHEADREDRMLKMGKYSED